MNDRLYRSVDDRVIAGVCGGLAERMDLDPSLVRVGYAILAIVTGIFPLLIVYIVMAAVVPEEPSWSGVRPVAPSPWDAGTSAFGSGPGPAATGAPTEGAPGSTGAAATGTSGAASSSAGGAAWPSAGMGSTTEGVPGWAPPGGTPSGLVPPGGTPSGWVPPGGTPPSPGWPGSGWVSPGVDLSDRHARRAARRAERDARRAARRDDPTLAILAGIVLVGLGAFFLLRQAFNLAWDLAWPGILVMLGVVLVIAALRPRRGPG